MNLAQKKFLEIMFHKDRFQAFIEDRAKFIHDFAWAIPHDREIARIARYLRNLAVVEICAGNGYWASLLAPYCASYVALDRLALDNMYFPVILCDVQDAQAFQQFAQDAQALVCIWPPYNSDVFTRALTTQLWSVVVYVGEREGGCTGDDSHWAHLNDRYTLRVNMRQYLNWDGIHSCLMIYTPKLPLDKNLKSV